MDLQEFKSATVTAEDVSNSHSEADSSERYNERPNERNVGNFSNEAKAFPGALDNMGSKTRLQELTRVERLFNFAQIFFLSLTFMSSWETMALNLWSVFYNGGPQVLAWGIVLVIIGACAQSASLAEMSSIQPIAGAQYHWVHLFAPKSIRNFTTWMQGWITWFAWISTLAGIANTTATMLQGIAILNYPDTYAPQRWHITLIITAMLLVESLMNIYTFWIIPWIELVSGILHVVLFVFYSVILLALAPRHQTGFVFMDRVDSMTTSGWTNNFVSWNLGLLTPIWGFVGFDAAVHLSEEVRKAKKAVPRVMFWSIALNGLLAYAWILVLLYTMGSVEQALDTETGFPILEIFVQVTGSTAAATAMGCGLLVVSLSVNLACIASVSRLTWAWSRDQALPSMFSIVSAKHRVPVRAIILSSLCVVLLSILNIPTTVAFGAFISLATMALYTSYMIAISCMVYSRFRAGGVKLGMWNLGRYGLAINLFALLYSAYATIWLPFPSTLPVTGMNMNYSLPIFAFVILLAIGLWFVRRGGKWQGPSAEIIELATKED